MSLLHGTWEAFHLGVWEKAFSFFIIINNSCLLIIFFVAKKKFKKRVEWDLPIPHLSNIEISKRLDSIPNITCGTKVGDQKLQIFDQTYNWTKKSIFLELPYWHTNLILHKLDVMHIEHNIFKNIFIMLDVPRKTKDNIRTRQEFEGVLQAIRIAFNYE